MKEKNQAAVELGKRGGLATKYKHSPDYYKEIRKQRKTYAPKHLT